MEDVNVFADGGRRGRMNDINSAEGVTSENLWERTDVLAGKDSFQWAFAFFCEWQEFNWFIWIIDFFFLKSYER